MNFARTIIIAAIVGTGMLPLSSFARTIIQNKGSDTLVNVAQAWAEQYQKVDPDLAIAVSGGGSGTGIAAMINGTVDIANASRAMKQKEVESAKSRGQDPVQHVVGYDALAVFVHADNPVETPSLPQLAEIYGEEGESTSIGSSVPDVVARAKHCLFVPGAPGLRRFADVIVDS